MKTNVKNKTLSKRRGTGAKREDVGKRELSTLRCRHCGGAMKQDELGVVCVMCGRLESHRCAECLNADQTNVAA
jgi:hypothetical protein